MLYTEQFYAIIFTLFPYFLPFCYPYITYLCHFFIAAGEYLRELTELPASDEERRGDKAELCTSSKLNCNTTLVATCVTSPYHYQIQM